MFQSQWIELTVALVCAILASLLVAVETALTGFSRGRADAGHSPAIDIEKSISRVMSAVTPAEQQQLARQLKSLWSAYRRSRELITIGAYTEGSDARIDRAIELMPMIEAFLCQEVHDPSSLQASVTAMRDLLASSPNRTTETESA